MALELHYSKNKPGEEKTWHDISAYVESISSNNDVAKIPGSFEGPYAIYKPIKGLDIEISLIFSNPLEMVNILDELASGPYLYFKFKTHGAQVAYQFEAQTINIQPRSKVYSYLSRFTVRAYTEHIIEVADEKPAKKGKKIKGYNASLQIGEKLVPIHLKDESQYFIAGEDIQAGQAVYLNDQGELLDELAEKAKQDFMKLHPIESIKPPESPKPQSRASMLELPDKKD